MTRWVVNVLVISATVMLSAGKPSPFTLQIFDGGGQGDTIIEKQSWWLATGIDPNHTVINSTMCSWDINDHTDFRSAEGSLVSGGTTNRSDCHVFDFNPIYSCRFGTCAWWSFPSNWAGIRVEASEPDVLVTMCFAPQGTCFSALSTYDKSLHAYIYNICVQAVYTPDDPALVDIDGSNGGRGLPTTIIRTVTNPSGRTIRTLKARWGLGSDVFEASGCPAYPTSGWPLQSAYPWRYIGVIR